MTAQNFSSQHACLYRKGGGGNACGIATTPFPMDLYLKRCRREAIKKNIKIAKVAKKGRKVS